MNKKSRSISTADTTLLITKAGGRCSYNNHAEFCNKVLSDGRVNLGERAHIVGVNGPRANEHCSTDLNGYDNLIWLCRDHHKIVDHESNLDRYTVAELQAMKQRHEARIATGRYPYYGTPDSLHDYGVLSCLFHFINIHTLYSCAASFPCIHLDFFDVSEMCYLFRNDNPGDLPLRDPLLRYAFDKFEHTHALLSHYLDHYPTVGEDPYSRIYTWRNSVRGERLTFRYLTAVEQLIGLIEKRFPQIMMQDIFDPGF
ncbi:hypothetical protein ACSHA6_004478 [Vibrio parahaemolyticus]